MIDKEILKAIELACLESGQPDSVSKKIIKWVESASERSLSPADVSDHLEVTVKSIDLERAI